MSKGEYRAQLRRRHNNSQHFFTSFPRIHYLNLDLRNAIYYALTHLSFDKLKYYNKYNIYKIFIFYKYKYIKYKYILYIYI